MNLFLQYVGLTTIAYLTVWMIYRFFRIKRDQRDRAKGRVRQPFRGYSPEC